MFGMWTTGMRPWVQAEIFVDDQAVVLVELAASGAEDFKGAACLRMVGDCQGRRMKESGEFEFDSTVLVACSTLMRYARRCCGSRAGS